MIKTKTRNGNDAVIYFIHPNQMRAIHGAVWECGRWAAMEWHADGRYNLTSEYTNDLIDTAGIDALRKECALGRP